MMNIRFFTLVLCSVIIFTTGCKKFLDVTPRGVVIPKLVAEYDGMLNATTITTSFPATLLYCTDDFQGLYTNTDQSASANTYYWREHINLDNEASPLVWGDAYRVIYNTNVIIQGVLNSEGADASKKQQVRAEALAVRANSYLDLLTVFAKAYNPATAANDAGLPWVTSTDVTATVPNRSSVKAVVDSMISNVITAATVLPEVNINKYRSTKYTAYGLLARIYLYIGDYANAGKYAELSLGAAHSIINLNSYTAITAAAGYPLADVNPEFLWQRSTTATVTFMLLSDSLKAFYNANDLRYTLFTVSNVNGINHTYANGRPNFGITFPEMYLTLAESHARAGKKDEAITLLNNLRKNRIKTAAYVALTASNANEALLLVLAERRREGAFSGTRWLDMKRLDREGRMPAVKRLNKDTKAEEEVLLPGSHRYTFQIPARVQMFNPGMELNPR